MTFADRSPRLLARVTGVFYLSLMLAGVFAQSFVADRLIAPGDAVTTASNILAHTDLFQWGFTIYMIEMACQVVVTVLFYELLRPVSRTLSLLAALIGLAGCVIKILSRLFYLTPAFLLGGAGYLTVFTREQLQALSLVFLTINAQGAGIALAFFGLSAIVKGYLIVRCTFLPRILGALSMMAGLSLLTFLSPTLGPRLFPLIAAIGLVAAVPQVVWLIAVGLDEPRWREQAGAGRRFVNASTGICDNAPRTPADPRRSS